MSRLSLDDLAVDSFDTAPEPSTPINTQQTANDPLCYSPFCGPTMQATCDTQTSAA